jgi:hypothetical protein
LLSVFDLRILLVIKGFAQNPMDNINNKGIIMKNRAVFIEVISPITPIKKGKMAPPAIPVHKIPDRDP